MKFWMVMKMIFNDAIQLSTVYNKTSSNVTIRDNSWTPTTAYIHMPYAISKYIQIKTSTCSKTLAIREELIDTGTKINLIIK